MRNNIARFMLILAAACSLVSGTAPAQESTTTAFADSIQALNDGNETRAWRLFKEKEAAFMGEIGSIDGRFVSWIADQYRKQERFDEARRVCEKAISKEAAFKPEDMASIMLVKGDVFRDQENFSAARLEYQGIERNKAFKSTPAGKAAQFRSADIFRMTKDYDAAWEILERLKDFPTPETQAEAYYISARIAFDQESFEEAREYIEEVKRRVPEHVESLFLEAELNLQEDRLQDPELEIGSRVLTTYVIPGRPVTMKMQDRNLAVVRGGAGIPVALETSDGKDTEVTTLLPSPRDPTLFRGTMSSRLGSAETNSSRLEITGADVVTYKILDAFQKANDLEYPEKKMLVAADGELTATSGEFISAEDRDKELFNLRMRAAMERESETMKAYERKRDTSVVRPGNKIRVQVVDYDRDMGEETDSIFVDAVTSSGDVVKGIQLTETEAHSGMFRGVIPTTNAPPRATASSSAEGKKPGSAINTQTPGVWISASGGEGQPWYEVDLMTVHPVDQAILDFVDAGSVKAASLWATAGDDLEQLAGTEPDDRQMYGYVDLAEHFGETPKTAAYLYTEVTSETDTDAVLKIGSCDGVVCWVNGERVHNNLGGRAWKPEEDSANAKLKAGVNGILLRVTQLTGPWGVSMTVQDATGKPLPSLGEFPPAKPGVVTQWHLFDRLTPENIQVAERVNVNRPVRIKDEQFKWIPLDVTPVADLSIEGNLLTATFHRSIGIRRLRWQFDQIAGPTVSVKVINASNRFGQKLVPSDLDFSTAAQNRLLELAPGDTIDISYRDERHIGPEEVLTATMRSSFYDAEIKLAYEDIFMNQKGEREIAYDTALRYRAGDTDRLVIHVEDYDADVSDDMDKLRVLAESSQGEKVWLDAIENEPHSGEFIAILRLGDATGEDTIKVGPNVNLSASYSDTENSDGHIERRASVLEASDDDPELWLYKTVVMSDEEIMAEETGKVKLTVKHILSEKGKTPEDPVTTSLDTSLVFSVVYPAAALSEEATYKATVSKADGEPVEVVMGLIDGEMAEFRGEVKLLTGNPEDYIEKESIFAQKKERIKTVTPRLQVKGDDILSVTALSIDGTQTLKGHYRLASDAMLSFTDRKYEEIVRQIHLGDYLYARLSDRDRDVSDELDQATITVAGTSGSHEMTLAETLPHSGLFTGRLKTEPVAVGEQTTESPEAVLRANWGDMLQVTYTDEASVLQDEPRVVRKTVHAYQGADGSLATFTKRFSDEDIAVKTRLLTAEALFELAKEHREMKQKEIADRELAEGKMVLEEAIADYPNTKHAPHAEFLLANLAQELEKYGEALERYNKVLSSWPDSEHAPRAMLKKAISLEKMEDFDNALDTYVELTYSYPRSELVSDAVVRLGQHFYRTKDFAIAGRIFANFHDRNPEHDLAPKALFLAGQSYIKGAEERKQALEGQYDPKAKEWLNEAINTLDRVVALYDDRTLRPEAMYWRADCYLKMGDMKNAYVSLKTLTWDYPESKWAKFARGQLVQHAQAFERIDE